jgi:hypothetical protein
MHFIISTSPILMFIIQHILTKNYYLMDVVLLTKAINDILTVLHVDVTGILRYT